MSEFSFNKRSLEDIVDISIFIWAEMIQGLAQDYAPRDKNNLPKNINNKNWEKPERNIRSNNKHYYRKPVLINWNWYEWVTWNLKRSIWTEKLWKWEYIIWVKIWPASDYAATHEFWDESRGIPKRSFLKRSIDENWKEVLLQIWKTFKELSDKQ
jgi:hypothetical protein